MYLIGQHKEKQVYYFDLEKDDLQNLPKENWTAIGIVNGAYKKHLFEKFVKHNVYSGLLEFKSQGKYGETLHNHFDEQIVELEIIEGYPETDIMTTWYRGEKNDLPNALWDSFNISFAPDSIDSARTKIICISMDGQSYQDTVQAILARLNEGWIPPDE